MWGSTVVVYRDNNGYVSTAAIAVTGDVLATEHQRHQLCQLLKARKGLHWLPRMTALPIIPIGRQD